MPHIAAAVHSWRRSLPLKPSVLSAILAVLTSSAIASPDNMTYRQTMDDQDVSAIDEELAFYCRITH